jgi:hypothetical protein
VSGGGAAIGAGIVLLALAPPLARILLAEQGYWFLPADIDAEVLPWRLMVERIAPLWVVVSTLTLVGALLGVCVGAIVRRSGVRHLLLASFRWALGQRSIWWLTLLMIAAIVTHRYFEHSLVLLVAMMGLMVAIGLSPLYYFRAPIAARPDVIPVGSIRSRVYLEGAVILMLSTAFMATLPSALAWADWLLDAAVLALVAAMLIRGQTIAGLWRSRKQLTGTWLLDVLLQQGLIFIALLPVLAWIFWFYGWVVHELPTLNHQGFELPIAAKLARVEWPWLGAPVDLFCICAIARLAWLRGLAGNRSDESITPLSSSA